MKVRKRPIVVDAIRYGDENGQWSTGIVAEVAKFMSGRSMSEGMTEHQIIDYLQPTGLWNPPENAELLLWDGVAHESWLPLALGDWVIKGVNGEFYPCKPDIFEATYEPV